MTSQRVVTSRFGLVPNLQPITLSEDGRLSVGQLQSITDAIAAITRAVNGRLTFGDGTHSAWAGNMDGHTKEVYFGIADYDHEVPHGLGRVPIGIIVLTVDQDGTQIDNGLGDVMGIGVVVRGSNEGSWTPTRMFVRCNRVGTTARFIVV